MGDEQAETMLPQRNIDLPKESFQNFASHFLAHHSSHFTHHLLPPLIFKKFPNI
jgi:hypothetical protein